LKVRYRVEAGVMGPTYPVLIRWIFPEHETHHLCPMTEAIRLLFPTFLPPCPFALVLRTGTILPLLLPVLLPVLLPRPKQPNFFPHLPSSPAYLRKFYFCPVRCCYQSSPHTRHCQISPFLLVH
jgi:hypothetical protein